MAKDTENFLDAMHDVQPLKHEKRVAVSSRPLDKVTIDARQEAAQAGAGVLADPLVNANVEQLEANTILAFQLPGVQHGVYRQLRLGKYGVEARLDLHRMTIDQSRIEVYQFVQDCIQHDVRCALITHGKGEGRATPAVLKSYVAHWLPQIPAVLAFHSAQKHHGGSGATYIMLKKSEKKRLENIEKHQ